MSPEHEYSNENLHLRISFLEKAHTETANDIKQIKDAIQQLVVNTAKAAASSCPAPGLCKVLQSDYGRMEADIDECFQSIRTMQKEFAALQKWQGTVAGGAAALWLAWQAVSAFLLR